MSLAPVALPPPSQLSLFDEAPPPPATAGPVAAPSPSIFRHPRSQREIRFGEHLVAYELRRARRRSIGFVVGTEGLTVSAPRWTGMGDVETALHAKSSWILRKLHEQRERGRRLA